MEIALLRPEISFKFQPVYFSYCSLFHIKYDEREFVYYGSDCFDCKNKEEQFILYFIPVYDFATKRTVILFLGKQIMVQMHKISSDADINMFHHEWKLSVETDVKLESKANNVWLGLNDSQKEKLRSLVTANVGTKLFFNKNFRYTSDALFAPPDTKGYGDTFWLVDTNL